MEITPGTIFEPTPTVDEVARIMAIRDPVLRNLHITYCYSRLSAAMSAQTGRVSNWCTFATWASRQAGATIRGEDLLDTLRRRFQKPFELQHPIRSIWRAWLRKGVFNPDTRLGRAVREIHSPFDALERTSDAVARGNLKVFEEIAREFARYLATCGGGAAGDEDALEPFLQELKPGNPPEGQEYLRRAFRHMHQRRLESDDAVRAELMALANIEIGFHEQTRLQQEIRSALDAPVVTLRDLKRRVASVLWPKPGVVRALIERGPIGSLLLRVIAAVRRYADALARQAVTEHLMVFSLPDGTFVPLGGPLHVAIPAALHSGGHTGLRALIARLERCVPGRASRGAEDWTDFEQRMHVILHVFCGFHDRADLFLAPFTPAQVQEIQSGRIPSGAL